MELELNNSYDPELEPGTERLGSSKDGEWIVYVNCSPSAWHINLITTTCFLWNSSTRFKQLLPNPEYIFGEQPFKCILERYEPEPSIYDSLEFDNSFQYDFPYRVCFFYHIHPHYIWWHPRFIHWFQEELTHPQLHHGFTDVVVVKLESSNEFCFISLYGNLLVGSGGRIEMQWPNKLPLHDRLLVQVMDSTHDQDLFLIERGSQCPWEVSKVDLVRRRFVPVPDGVAIFVNRFYSAATAIYPMPEFPKFPKGRRANFVCYTEVEDRENFYVLWLDDLSLSIFRNRPDSGFPVWFPQLNALGKNWLAFVDDDFKLDEAERENHRVRQQQLEDIRPDDQHTIVDKLPEEVQWYISKNFSDNNNLKDYWNFRLVCRKWRELAPAICWKPASSYSDQRFPWLMTLDSVIDPTNSVRYHYRSRISTDIKIQYSIGGWLLVTEGMRTIFFFEPFSRTRVNLPSLPEGFTSVSMAFSQWVIVSTSFLPGSFRVDYLRSDDMVWNNVSLNEPFRPSGCSPVCYRNKFYFLDNRGSLAAFMFRPDRTPLLEKLTLPPIICKSQQLRFTSYRRGHLVFCGNKIYIVVLELGKFVNVYHLDGVDREWKEVRTFWNNYSVFISRTSSLAVLMKECPEKQNTVNFPLYDKDDRCLYYKLDTSEFKFHEVQDHKSSVSAAELYDIKESVSAVWISPKVVQAYRT